MGPLLDRPRPRLAVGVGISLTIVVALAVAPLRDEVTRSVPALLLVVPVIVAAVLGGRAPAFIIAAAATLAFSLALPPFGSLRIRLGEDVVALVVFSAVAFVASALVTTKMDTLHDVDAQRRALLRSVSHDLRTPLSAIHAVATDLRSGTMYDDATRNELLDIMIDETDRLDRFVANLLSMSRIEAGTLQADMQPVDVTELLERVTHRFERSGARAIKLDVPARSAVRARRSHAARTGREQPARQRGATHAGDREDLRLRPRGATRGRDHGERRWSGFARGRARTSGIGNTRHERGSRPRHRRARSCSCTAVPSPSPTGDPARH